MCFLKQGIVGFLEGSKGFEGCGVSSSAAVRKNYYDPFLSSKEKRSASVLPNSFSIFGAQFSFYSLVFFLDGCAGWSCISPGARACKWTCHLPRREYRA